MLAYTASRRRVCLDWYEIFERQNFVLVALRSGDGEDDLCAGRNKEYISQWIVRKADFDRRGKTRRGNASFKSISRMLDWTTGSVAEMKKREIPLYSVFTARSIRSFIEEYDVEKLHKGGMGKTSSFVDFFRRDDRYDEGRIRLFDSYDYSLYGADISKSISRAIFFGNVPYITGDDFDLPRMLPYLYSHPRVSDVEMVDVPYYNAEYYGQKTVTFKLLLTQEEWDVSPHKVQDFIYPYYLKGPENQKDRVFDLTQFYLKEREYDDD